MDNINQLDKHGRAIGYWDGIYDGFYYKGFMKNGNLFTGYAKSNYRYYMCYPHGWYLKNGLDWGYEYKLNPLGITLFFF